MIEYPTITYNMGYHAANEFERERYAYIMSLMQVLWQMLRMTPLA